MDGWFLKNHIINYFFLVWLQSSNFDSNKSHASMVLIAGSAWLLLKGPVSLMGLSLPPPSPCWWDSDMKGTASVVINSLGLFARPACVLLAAFCGTIQRTNSAALQKTNTWIQLVSVLNSDRKFQFCSCFCLVKLCWLAKILTDTTFF